MNELHYSYSNGKYWSKYNKCKLWENKEYDILVRDKNGQIATQKILIDNNIKTMFLENPLLETDYIEYSWSDKNKIIVRIIPRNENEYVDYKINDGAWIKETVKGEKEIEINCINGINILYYRTRDDNDNLSIINTFVIKTDFTSPSNINCVSEALYNSRIITTVTAVENLSLPLKYSISYDDGATWSKEQYGNKFLLSFPEKGTYKIKCRAFNSVGNYVESSTKIIII